MEHNKGSSPSMKEAGDVNEFTIGSKIIRGQQSTARIATSDSEMCVAIQNAVNTPDENSSNGAANCILMSNSIIIEVQNRTNGKVV